MEGISSTAVEQRTWISGDVEETAELGRALSCLISLGPKNLSSCLHTASYNVHMVRANSWNDSCGVAELPILCFNGDADDFNDGMQFPPPQKLNFLRRFNSSSSWRHQPESSFFFSALGMRMNRLNFNGVETWSRLLKLGYRLSRLHMRFLLELHQNANGRPSVSEYTETSPTRSSSASALYGK